MVNQGPINQVQYKLFDHYRYPPVVFYELGLTYSQIIDASTQSLLLPNGIPATGVSLIVPPMQKRIVRLVLRATMQIRIQNTLNGGALFPFSAELTEWGNVGPLPQVNIDGAPTTGFTGKIDYLDIGPQVSRVNFPGVYINFGLSAANFDTTVFNPGALGSVLIVITPDIYGYHPDMIPPTLI